MSDKKKHTDPLEDKIKELETKLAEVEGSKLMILADYDNYKKRVAKEREDFTLIGNSVLLNVLFDILDDLQRAAKDMKEGNEGIQMIVDKVNHVLNDQGLEKIDVKEGDTFDPKKMEAIGTITVKDENQNNKVIHVDRSGYKYKDKEFVIRGCRVIVGKFQA